MLIGYARVSTNDQETRMQLDALEAAGVLSVHSEKGSSVGPRPELHKALARMKAGDVLVVWKLDRLARSLKDLLGLLERLRAMGCSFKSLTEPIDTTTPLGEFVLQMLGAVAQFERSLIRERAIAGQVAYIKEGGQFGRPKKLTSAQEADCFNRFLSGQSKASLAREFGCSTMVVRRIVSEGQGVKRAGARPVLKNYL